MDNQDNTETNLSTNRPPTRTDGPAPSQQPTSTLPTGPSRSWRFWSTKLPFLHDPDSADSRIDAVPAENHPKLAENYKSLKKDFFPIKKPLSTLSGEEADLILRKIADPLIFRKIEDPMVYADGEGYLAVTVYVKHGTVLLETAKEVAVNMKACLNSYGLDDIEVAIMECSWG